MLQRPDQRCAEVTCGARGAIAYDPPMPTRVGWWVAVPVGLVGGILVAFPAAVSAATSGSSAGTTSAAIGPSPAVDEWVWITLGEDAFASAERVVAQVPPFALLERLGEERGVVLTRLSNAAIPLLAERIHEELRRCGGFVVHASRAEADAEMARLAAPERAPEALPFAIDRPDWVVPLATAVDESQILATITALSTNFTNRYHLHPSGTASAHWIRDLWAGYAAARPEVTVALYNHGATTPQPSVILTVPGTTLAGEIVVLGAHQDSTRSGCMIQSTPACVAPGADDDASGIATLSEVIRVVLDSSFQPQRTVQFMAYAAEEVGLLGSGQIAQAYFDASANVVAVLQQDMTGFHGSAEDIALITDNTNAELNAFVGDLLSTYQPQLLWTTTACGYACSDHARWHQKGYRAAFAFEARMGQHNVQLHTVNDTVATLGGSAAHAAKFARLAVAFAVEASLDLVPGIFADDFESGDSSAWTMTASEP